MLSKIKRILNRCDSCWREADFHFELHDVEYEGEESKEVIHHFYNCYKHALKSGFCLGCGGFWAGVESFDFSKVKGYCSDCVDELEDELGIGECYGDYDYYDDYEHDFEEKQTPNQSSTTHPEGNCDDPTCPCSLMQPNQD